MDPKPRTEPSLSTSGTLPQRVDVYEVGPRDGLQNESRVVPTEDKARLIRALIAAGEKRIEVTSFVSPKWIPPLADADALMGMLERPEGVTFTALVPNLKGLERAKAAGIGEVAIFLSASEAHSKRNINKSIAQALETSREVSEAALKHGMRVRGYLSTVWGCPDEGDVPVSQVLSIVRELRQMGLYQLSLGDTVGLGTPGQTQRILSTLLEHVPASWLALHMHDTRGLALVNSYVGLQMGITTFDASVGGLGGCPYAPGASGNLSTEDLVFMLHGLGIETGVALDKLVDAGALAQEIVGRKLSGRYLQAALGQREKGVQNSGRP